MDDDEYEHFCRTVKARDYDACAEKGDSKREVEGYVSLAEKDGWFQVGKIIYNPYSSKFEARLFRKRNL